MRFSFHLDNELILSLQLVQLDLAQFDIEPGQDCRFDNVTVYTGSMDANTSYTYCGNYFPYRITSKGNSLTLVFQTDNIVPSTGFSFNFTAVRPNDDTTGVYIAGCIFHAFYGKIIE